MKKYIYLLTAVLVTILIISYSIQNAQLHTARAENSRLSSNVSVLNKNYTTYKTAYGHAAAKVEALKYTQEEMKVYEANLLHEIGELQIKPKNVISVAQVGTQTSTIIPTKIIYVDSVKCLAYEDRFTTLSGCFKGDSINLLVENRDSLTTVVSKVPKHYFLWWSWGVKAINLNILSQNPNTKFTYVKYIELK